MTSETDQVILINSKEYGPLEITAEQVIAFPRGIVGISDHKQFAMLALPETPFFILHSLSGDLSFILVDASAVVEPYEFELSDETVQLLQAKQPQDISILLIVNIVNKDFYVNLKAPILITTKERKGCQYIIQDHDYPVRQPLKMKENK